MAVAPGFVLRAIARFIAGRVASELVERATGQDLPDIEDVIDFLQGDLGKSVEDASTDEVERALERGLRNGQISRRQVEAVEANLMVDFNAYMSIALSKCGNDEETFTQLTRLWNREKDQIQQMTQAELRQELRCP